MKAVISGEARAAVLFRGGKAYLLKAGAEDPPKLIDQDLISLVFQAVDDVETVSVQSETEAREMLDGRVALQQAWQRLGTLLDAQAAPETRQRCARKLGEQFAAGDKETIGRLLENKLYARPLPERADLPGAIELVQSAAAGRPSPVCDLLIRLRDLQTSVIQVNNVWGAIAMQVFAANEQRAIAEHNAIATGLFRDLVMSKGNSEAIAKLRQQHARRRDSMEVLGWTKAIELICDKMMAKPTVAIIASSDVHIEFVRKTLREVATVQLHIEVIKTAEDFQRLQTERKKYDLIFLQDQFWKCDHRPCSPLEAVRRADQLRDRGGLVCLLLKTPQSYRDDSGKGVYIGLSVVESAKENIRQVVREVCELGAAI